MARASGTRPRGRRTPEERLVDAALATAAEGGWRRATLDGIARRARVAPGAARAAFRTPEDVLDAFSAGVDAAALAEVGAEDLAAVPPRERLLELLLCRLDRLEPRLDALRGLAAAALASPVAGFRAACRVERSMGAMLDAAGLAGAGLMRAARARILALVWLRALRRRLRGADADAVLAGLDRDLRRLDRLAALAAGAATAGSGSRP